MDTCAALVQSVTFGENRDRASNQKLLSMSARVHGAQSIVYVSEQRKKRIVASLHI